MKLSNMLLLLFGLAAMIKDKLKKINIPCLGEWVWTEIGEEFECGYGNAQGMSCEECIINGGEYNPETGELNK